MIFAVGVNCHFDTFLSLETIKKMKAGLEAAGLHPYLFLQPLGYHTPDVGRQGFIDLPEFPFAMEPRIFTRYKEIILGYSKALIKGLTSINMLVKPMSSVSDTLEVVVVSNPTTSELWPRNWRRSEAVFPRPVRSMFPGRVASR